jgi:hypothetical protein
LPTKQTLVQPSKPVLDIDRCLLYGVGITQIHNEKVTYAAIWLAIRHSSDPISHQHTYLHLTLSCDGKGTLIHPVNSSLSSVGLIRASSMQDRSLMMSLDNLWLTSEFSRPDDPCHIPRRFTIDHMQIKAIKLRMIPRWSHLCVRPFGHLLTIIALTFPKGNGVLDESSNFHSLLSMAANFERLGTELG